MHPVKEAFCMSNLCSASPFRRPLQGNTAVYQLYAHARISSIGRKSGEALLWLAECLWSMGMGVLVPAHLCCCRSSRCSRPMQSRAHAVASRDVLALCRRSTFW